MFAARNVTARFTKARGRKRPSGSSCCAPARALNFWRRRTSERIRARGRDQPDALRERAAAGRRVLVRAREHAVAQPEQRLAGTARDLSADAGDHSAARARPGRLRPESDRLLQPGTAVLPDAQDHGRRPLLLRRAVSTAYGAPRRRDGEAFPSPSVPATPPSSCSSGWRSGICWSRILTSALPRRR